jgi:hypothetical protein
MFAHVFLPIEWIAGSVGNRFRERKGKPAAALRPMAARPRRRNRRWAGWLRRPTNLQ